MFFVLLCFSFLSVPVFASSNSSTHPSLFFQNSSKKSYLLHQAKQREFQQRRLIALKQRQKQLKKLQKQKELKNKIEDMEFQSHIDPDKLPPLNQRLSKKEETYWEHQNQIRFMEVARKRAFLKYKKQNQNYEKKKRSAVQTRLKKTQILRQKFKPVENSPF